MLSGIGPEEHLRAFGIPVVHELPGVGENFQDHAGTAHTAWVNRTTYNVQTRPWHYLVILLTGHKFIRTIFETEPMARHVVEEYSPGKTVQSDDKWRAFIRETAIGVYHPAGTCKMGHDRMAVVDDRLRVHGIEELYVVDASIMPFVVSANLNGNCIMIGEKVSDMILAAR